MRVAQSNPKLVHVTQSTQQEYFQPSVTGQEEFHPGSAGQNLPSTSIFVILF